MRTIFILCIVFLLPALAIDLCYSGQAYIYDAQGANSGGTLKLYHVGNDKYKAVFSVWGGQNTGEFSGEGFLKGNQISITSNDLPECFISIVINGKKITANQRGSDFQCGLGRDVSASGEYSFVGIDGKPKKEEIAEITRPEGKSQSSQPSRARQDAEISKSSKQKALEECTRDCFWAAVDYGRASSSDKYEQQNAITRFEARCNQECKMKFKY